MSSHHRIRWQAVGRLVTDPLPGDYLPYHVRIEANKVERGRLRVILKIDGAGAEYFSPSQVSVHFHQNQADLNLKIAAWVGEQMKDWGLSFLTGQTEEFVSQLLETWKDEIH